MSPRLLDLPCLAVALVDGGVTAVVEADVERRRGATSAALVMQVAVGPLGEAEAALEDARGDSASSVRAGRVERGARAR